MTSISLTAKDLLPEDGTRGTLAGRVWLPQANGPAVVAVRGDGVFDVTARFPTISALCEEDDPARALAATRSERIGDLEAIVANTPPDSRDVKKPWLLAPVDLQTLKAAGVWTPRPWSKSHPDTGCGDPSKATAEKGRRYVNLIAHDVAKVLVELSHAGKGELPYV